MKRSDFLKSVLAIPFVPKELGAIPKEETFDSSYRLYPLTFNQCIPYLKEGTSYFIPAPTTIHGIAIYDMDGKIISEKWLDEPITGSGMVHVDAVNGRLSFVDPII